MTDREQPMDLESAIKVLRQALRQGTSLRGPATGVAESIVDEVWPVVEYLEARQEARQEKSAEDLERGIKVLRQALRQGTSLRAPATGVAQSIVDEVWPVVEYLEACLEEAAED